MNFGKITFIMLEKSCNDPNVFWDVWKSCTQDAKTNLGTKINGDKWYIHLHTADAVDIIKLIWVQKSMWISDTPTCTPQMQWT